MCITDPAMPEVLVTQDVDVIVEVASRLDYYRLEEEQRQSQELLADNAFLDALPGHLSPDRASQPRLPLLIKRMRKIAEMSD